MAPDEPPLHLKGLAAGTAFALTHLRGGAELRLELLASGGTEAVGLRDLLQGQGVLVRIQAASLQLQVGAQNQAGPVG